MPVAKGGMNSRILLLSKSLTQRFPDLSKTASKGNESPPLPPPTVFSVRLAWPIAREALVPVDMGGGYSTTLLFCASAVQRFPLESSAAEVGNESCPCPATRFEM